MGNQLGFLAAHHALIQRRSLAAVLLDARKALPLLTSPTEQYQKSTAMQNAYVAKQRSTYVFPMGLNISGTPDHIARLLLLPGSIQAPVYKVLQPIPLVLIHSPT